MKDEGWPDEVPMVQEDQLPDEGWPDEVWVAKDDYNRHWIVSNGKNWHLDKLYVKSELMEEKDKHIRSLEKKVKDLGKRNVKTIELYVTYGLELKERMKKLEEELIKTREELDSVVVEYQGFLDLL